MNRRDLLAAIVGVFVAPAAALAARRARTGSVTVRDTSMTKLLDSTNRNLVFERACKSEFGMPCLGWILCPAVAAEAFRAVAAYEGPVDRGANYVPPDILERMKEYDPVTPGGDKRCEHCPHRNPLTSNCESAMGTRPNRPKPEPFVYHLTVEK